MKEEKRIGSKELAELEKIRLRNANRILQPVEIVEAARAKRNPLHDFFEWEDSIAAGRFRLLQARWLIARIEVTPSSDPNLKTRMYVSFVEDRTEEGGGYTHIAEILDDEERRERLIDQALEEFERIRRKYETLLALKEIFEAIDETKRKRSGTKKTKTGKKSRRGR